MAGKIIADTLEHSTAGSVDTQYVVNGSAKAWIDHNQVTSHSIRDSLNISSITDAGTGQTYPISFSNNMSSSSYAGSMYTGADANSTYNQFQNDYAGGFGSKTTSSFGHHSYGSGHVDSYKNDNIIHGDLA